MASTRLSFVLQFAQEYGLQDHHPALNFAGYPSCVFKPGNLYPFHLAPQKINLKEVLYNGNYSTVYAGFCEDGTEVALKFTPDYQDILNEASAYDNFESIQGTVLPKLYGVLYHRDSYGDAVLCLVLERFGNRLDREFNKLESLQKAKILNQLAAAHRAGLWHLAFAERNVLERDGEYRITDLGRVKEHLPRCSWTCDFETLMGADRLMVDDETTACSEIRSEARMMGFWDDGVVYLSYDHRVPKSRHLPCQEVIDRTHVPFGIGKQFEYSIEDRQAIAIKYYKEIKRRMNRGQTVQYLVEHRARISYDVHKQWHKSKKIPFDAGDFYSRLSPA